MPASISIVFQQSTEPPLSPFPILTSQRHERCLRFFPRSLVPDPFLGVPQSLVPCPFGGGGYAPASGHMSYPGGGTSFLAGGTPVLAGQDRTRVPPGQDRTGVPQSPARTGVPPPPPRLVTPRAVCLFRSPAGVLSCGR